MAIHSSYRFKNIVLEQYFDLIYNHGIKKIPILNYIFKHDENMLNTDNLGLMLITLHTIIGPKQNSHLICNWSWYNYKLNSKAIDLNTTKTNCGKLIFLNDGTRTYKIHPLPYFERFFCYWNIFPKKNQTPQITELSDR